MDLAIVSGFTVYLPKYIETQFGFSKSKASLLTGQLRLFTQWTEIIRLAFVLFLIAYL